MRPTRLTFISYLHAIPFSLPVLAFPPNLAFAEMPERYRLADLKALQEAFVELAAEIQPTVVAVRTYRTFQTSEGNGASVKVPLSQGSGFVIDGEGYIATNRHVVQDADVISIRLNDGTAHDAVLLQADPRSDLAVLKIETDGLKAARWGDLTEVKVNQWVFACGNPFGLANDDGRPSVALGVVSALGRHMTNRLVGDSEVEYYGNLIETTAPIHPGNSGGPLFDVDGNVIGVMTAIENGSHATENHGFAIPVDRNTRRILATLKAGHRVRYGFLGIQVEEVEPPPTGRVVSTRPASGAMIREIKVANGPAAAAGLKPRDVVIEYDGTPVENADHLVRMVGFTPVGSEAVVTFLRSGVRRRATVVVGDRAELLRLPEQTPPGTE
jgi:serine protease Do